MTQRPTVPCKHCAEPTPMLGTQLCDPCWLLERHISQKPEAAQKILDNVLERKGVHGNIRLLSLCMAAILAGDSQLYPIGQRALEKLKLRNITPTSFQ